jgi:very-short-patch-repair endonuclease
MLQAEQSIYDMEDEAWLQKQGFRIHQIWNNEATAPCIYTSHDVTPSIKKGARRSGNK